MSTTNNNNLIMAIVDDTIMDEEDFADIVDIVRQLTHDDESRFEVLKRDRYQSPATKVANSLASRTRPSKPLKLKTKPKFKTNKRKLSHLDLF
jgi:hypothetical protein